MGRWKKRSIIFAGSIPLPPACPFGRILLEARAYMRGEPSLAQGFAFKFAGVAELVDALVLGDGYRLWNNHRVWTVHNGGFLPFSETDGELLTGGALDVFWGTPQIHLFARHSERISNWIVWTARPFPQHNRPRIYDPYWIVRLCLLSLRNG